MIQVNKCAKIIMGISVVVAVLSVCILLALTIIIPNEPIGTLGAVILTAYWIGFMLTLVSFVIYEATKP